MEILQWLQLLSENVTVERSVNNYILLAYIVLFLFTKKVAPFAAFFMSCLIMEMALFDSLKEYQLYLLMCVIYSYVFEICLTRKSKTCCAIIVFLSMLFAVDAYLYGVSGKYGTFETAIYNNIERLALLAHILLIYSFIHFRGILNRLRSMFDDAISGQGFISYMFCFLVQYRKSKR